MHKVIVEEPRHGGHRTKKNRRDALPFDLLPTKEGMRRPHIRRKWFGEHLGPLKRWLRSKVGQPWNDVYSEACAVIKPNDVVRLQIRTHMMDFVKRHTFMRNGEVWYFDRFYEAPINSLVSATVRPKFYVHPETGILHEAQQWKKSREPWPKRKAQLTSVSKWVNDNLLLVRLDGLWFACEMKPYSHAPEHPPFDIIAKNRIADIHGYELYSRFVYCVAKRQLSRRELKKHDLHNSRKPLGLFDAVDPSLPRRIQGANGNPVRDRLQGIPCFEAGFYFNIFTLFDGSMNWVFVHHDVVVGSNPTPGIMPG
jgi:hypothetical protein